NHTRLHCRIRLERGLSPCSFVEHRFRGNQLPDRDERAPRWPLSSAQRRSRRRGVVAGARSSGTRPRDRELSRRRFLLSPSRLLLRGRDGPTLRRLVVSPWHDATLEQPPDDLLL